MAFCWGLSPRAKLLFGLRLAKRAERTPLKRHNAFMVTLLWGGLNGGACPSFTRGLSYSPYLAQIYFSKIEPFFAIKNVNSHDYPARSNTG